MSEHLLSPYYMPGIGVDSLIWYFIESSHNPMGEGTILSLLWIRKLKFGEARGAAAGHLSAEGGRNPTETSEPARPFTEL